MPPSVTIKRNHGIPITVPPSCPATAAHDPSSLNADAGMPVKYTAKNGRM